ncbi:hypothetical protein H8959_012636 [Pygathrix nigripes]
MCNILLSSRGTLGDFPWNCKRGSEAVYLACGPELALREYLQMLQKTHRYRSQYKFVCEAILRVYEEGLVQMLDPS